MSNIRETDAIIHVLRCFDDNNIVHVDGNVDPILDKETIDTELQLKDLETVESRLAKEEQLLLCDDESIVWVVGQRIDDRYRIKAETEMVLRINFYAR